MTKITDIADVIRSKNAGPFEVTMDIIFKSNEIYQKVKASGVITEESLAKLYKMDKSKITTFVWYDHANAVKVTFIRSCPSGRMGDRDVYGAQQHALLYNLEFPF